MISNKGSVREKLKQLGGYDGYVDPVDWLMGSDVGVLKIGAKQGVAKQLFLLRRLQGGGGGGGGAQRRHKAPSAPLSPRLFSGGQQAVVKLVRNGGTQTARGLKAQITYLSREGEVDVERSERFFGTVIDEDGQNRLAASWGLDEPNETGVDKTSHFVVSFPIGTDREAAALAGRAWAEELFDSGKYGDVYDYYTVSHNDTEHPHVHVIVNRRGVEEGAWLKISKRGPIDYQKLRDVQVEAAREHGIHLEATPRTARGETDRPYTDVEVKRADREQRSPTRPNHTEQSASKTAISVLDHAAKINAEAEVLKKDLPEISQSLKSIADGLKKGISIQKVLHSEKVVDLGEAKHMSNLLIQSREKVVRSFQQVEAQVQSLPQGSEQRIAIERQIADNRSQAALSIEQFKQDKLQAERDGAYKGVSANDAVGEGIKTTAEKQVETIARKAGLDPVKTLQRYNGTRAVHQKQADEWRDQEIKEAGDAGFTADDVDNAHKNIKSVYNEARENLRSHEDNKRQIVRSAENQDAQEQNNQTREDLAEDRFNRVRAVITPEQRQRLERGDASQLSSVSNDPNTQRIIARDYLNAAIERADPVQQNQLAQSRNAIETQLREQAAEQQRQSAQRQGRGDDGISR